MKKILSSQSKSRYCILLSFIALFLFPNITNAGYFVVQHASSDFVVISDNTDQYILDYNYECYDSDFSEGDTIYIKSTFTPLWGDTIITQRYYSLKTCKVESVEEVNLKVYFVNKVLDSDAGVIVTDKLNNISLITYGTGCLGLWRYENKNIFIDIGGSFLDGIGDTIYLPRDGADCRVWNAEKIFEDGFGIPYRRSSYEPTATPKCPIHSTYTDTKCICNTGYVANTKGDGCITTAKACENQYGKHVLADSEGVCRCKEGYEFNNTKSACINILCPAHSSRISGKCVCNEGYIRIAGVCFAGGGEEEGVSTKDQQITELKRTIRILQEKIAQTIDKTDTEQ